MASCTKVICSGHVVQLGVSKVEPPPNTDLDAEMSPVGRTVDTMAERLRDAENEYRKKDEEADPF